ncbi:antibiotic biosynthesis monooxygenase [Avibacterium sp. 20-15]|uniref:putative quinol monooxygenase n=1 Tax=unclassified Avibacterium TaxID=2685287 RepID=UPI0020266159|nr:MULTISPECIES: antibiotic biosynthesis monooxygenase [unclassified Avibacterium]MCW9733321.1 antibiotic biosynthesis monooxygenase [Avibacterium sp. 20-15]URL03195.1 antibiotic biosynthesis monooxygenase [Avibacterium sp. 20-132]
MEKLIIVLTLFTSLNVEAVPIMNFFELGIVRGQNSAYDQVARHNIETSIKNEKGTLAMIALQSKDNPQIGYMLELYADETAYQIHKNSPQYHYFLAQSPKILTDHKKFTPLTLQFWADEAFIPHKAMQTNLVKVRVKPEYQVEFAQIVKNEMQIAIEKEEESWLIAAGTERNSPNQWLFFEIYADAKAYEQHRKTAHFQEYLAETAKMIEKKEGLPVRINQLGKQGNSLILKSIE